LTKFTAKGKRVTTAASTERIVWMKSQSLRREFTTLKECAGGGQEGKLGQKRDGGYWKTSFE